MRDVTSTQAAWTPTVSRTTRDWLETKKYWGEMSELKAEPTTTYTSLGCRLLDRNSLSESELKAEPNTTTTSGYRLLNRNLFELKGRPTETKLGRHLLDRINKQLELEAEPTTSATLGCRLSNRATQQQSQREIPRELLTNNRRKIQISYHSDTSDGLRRATSDTGTKRLTNNSATTTLTFTFLLFRRGNL